MICEQTFAWKMGRNLQDGALAVLESPERGSEIHSAAPLLPYSAVQKEATCRLGRGKSSQGSQGSLALRCPWARGLVPAVSCGRRTWVSSPGGQA